MPIKKGDRVGHLDGFLGFALEDEAEGTVQVRHDNGAVSAWLAANASVISRGPDTSTSPAATPARSTSKRASRRKSGAKRTTTKKVAKKRTTRRRSARKPKSRVAARKRGTKTTPSKRKKRRRP
jgi:hypothetical protein